MYQMERHTTVKVEVVMPLERGSIRIAGNISEDGPSTITVEKRTGTAHEYMTFRGRRQLDLLRKALETFHVDAQEAGGVLTSILKPTKADTGR